MKLQRIIQHLEDGRRKYVTHNGQMEKWTEVEIENLRTNLERFGPAAYTADFAKPMTTDAGRGCNQSKGKRKLRIRPFLKR